jgi:hypothetical protein
MGKNLTPQTIDALNQIIKAQDETIQLLTVARDQARDEAMSCLHLVARIREAVGDTHRLMQDDLVAHCRELRAKAEAL